MLSVLHEPLLPVSKDVAFADAEYGSEAIEEALSLYYTKLVKRGMITMQDIVRLCVQNPAKSIGKAMGEIKVGENINAVLFDPSEHYHVKNSLSLYNDEWLDGKVKAVFKNSKTIEP